MFLSQAAQNDGRPKRGGGPKSQPPPNSPANSASTGPQQAANSAGGGGGTPPPTTGRHQPPRRSLITLSTTTPGNTPPGVTIGCPMATIEIDDISPLLNMSKQVRCCVVSYFWMYSCRATEIHSSFCGERYLYNKIERTPTPFFSFSQSGHVSCNVHRTGAAPPCWVLSSAVRQF